MTGLLQDKKALVTGGSKGIGAAIAIALAQEGADVVIGHYRDGENATSVTKAIADKGRKGTAFDADVSDEKAAIALVRHAADFLGGLDILMNNAGMQIESRLVDTRAEDFDRVIAVNLRGPFLVGREAARIMIAQGRGGRIINTASELSYLGHPGMTSYTAAKGGILTMTRTWARELAPDILVNAIAPGPIDTDLLGWSRMPPERQRAAEAAIVLRRIGRPEEIAGAAVYLAGPGASYVTGQCFGVNGGAVMV